MGETEKAVELIERGERLNPHFPYWYNQAWRDVYFAAQMFDKALAAEKRFGARFALDFALAAMTHAYLGNDKEAKEASATTTKLDPMWSAEQWVWTVGFPEPTTNMVLQGAQKAGLQLCMPESVAKELPDSARLKQCEERRAKDV